MNIGIMENVSKPSLTKKPHAKWNVLRHGILWARRLGTTISRQQVEVSEVDNPQQSPSISLFSNGSNTIANRRKKRLPVVQSPPDLQSQPKRAWSNAVPDKEQSSKLRRSFKSNVVKSSSFGDRLRISSSKEKGSFSPLKLRSAGPLSSIKVDWDNSPRNEESEFAVNRELPQAWPLSYSPLPSPLIDVFGLDFSQAATFGGSDELDDTESVLSNDLEKSLESEAGAIEKEDNFKRSASRHPSEQPKAEDDDQQVELIQRRGRRQAVIDEKNLFGEDDLESQDSLASGNQDNRNSEGKASPDSRLSSRVPAATMLQEKDRRILRKQHTIADLSSRNHPVIVPQDFDPKRRANVFLKLIERRSRSKESLLDLCDALGRLTASKFQDHYLESFRNSHWSQLTEGAGKQMENPESSMPDREVRRREAVWELFKSELTFCMDHLMVLKNCFMEPLKKLQVDGYLMFVEPSNLFGNLDDLCYVSHTLCRELIGNLSRSLATKDFGSTDVLIGPLKRWAEHSKNGEVYHNYCLNYDSALSYLDTMRKHEQFNEFEKWCEQDSRCRRLQLTDLLIAPMQHYMKIPLLLSSIRKYTADRSEQEMITNCLNTVDSSLKSLEDKMRWLKNFERLQEIQAQLIWPSISEMEPRVFIPELLRQSLARQPCERLIANPKRQLLYEGFLTLNDGSKIIDVFAFLFDDFFLITRIKKQPKKKSLSENPVTIRSMTEGGVFVVYRQAIALDRFTIHDIGIAEATANGLRHAIVLILITRFQQITGVYTLQAANELDKQRWIEKLRISQQQFQLKLKTKLHGLNSIHQTNKHSKLLTQQKKSAKTYEEKMFSDDFVTIIPATKISPSPLSSPEKQPDESENPISKENATKVLISPPDPELLSTTESTEVSQVVRPDSDVEEHPITFSNKPDDKVSESPECIDEHKSSIVRRSVDPELLQFQSRQVKGSGSTRIDDAPCAQSIPKSEPIPTGYTPSEMAAKRSPETPRETKVEFLYNATGRPAFSPPLSPTLYPPCAQVPSEVTIPSYYEVDEGEAVKDQTEKEKKIGRFPRQISSSLRIPRSTTSSSTRCASEELSTTERAHSNSK